MTLDEIYKALKRPFEEKQISWRVGSTNSDKTQGIALAYIDARDVMERLDNVMGLDWQCKYSHADQKTICDLGLLIDGEWIWRAGGAGDSDIEAEKGAVSDAFKRAAVLFGVGRYLYSLPNQWFPITPFGRSYKLDGTPVLPKWATPKGWDEAMAKRERCSGTPETVGQNVWNSLDETTQRMLQGVVDEVRSYLYSDIERARKLISTITDPDEYVAMWSRLDSKERSLIKAASTKEK